MQDNFYMRRCLDLAQLGAGKVSPNPMVGCVIVYNDKIIGEGYHRQYGMGHAEVNAVNAVLEAFGNEAPALLKASVVYVNLEPCAHYGKTPPCADMLIANQVKKVVIGNRDPYPEVNGKGIEKLKKAGIEVISEILDTECRFLNRRFFTRVTSQRPYIILKWAQTANGFFAPSDGSMKWITGGSAKTLVHKWRTEEDAILVGKNTAITDNPELTARHWDGKNPVRVLVDRDLKVPRSSKIYNAAAQTIVLNEVKTAKEENIQFIQLEDMSFYLPEKLMYQLYLMDIQSVMIEGGANILSLFIAAGLWDEARVLSSAAAWDDGLIAPVLSAVTAEHTTIGNDDLAIYYNKK